MGEFDRRMAMKLGGSVALSAIVSGRPFAADAPPRLFVFDARFALSKAAAIHWRERGATLLDPRVRDLGLAWREEIPRILARGGAMAGLTPWSDRLLCEMMGRDYGLSLRKTGASDQLYGWHLI